MHRYLFVGVFVFFAVVTELAQARVIRLGVTPGSHERVAEEVEGLLASKGHSLKIIAFSDYVLPNRALAEGDLDANSFQHAPYLEQQKESRGV